ncbi:MAG: hypothetical protein AAGC88_16100, partial [Bacteroidota bacterium]
MPYLNFWDLLMVIGIAQGFVMSVVLLTKKGQHISSRFLGVIFFTMAFSLLGTLISEKEPQPVTAFYTWLMRYVPFWPIMLIGPCLLFLIQSQTDSAFKFDRRKKVHYIAALFHLIPTIAWISAWLRYKLDWVQYDKPKFLQFIYTFYTQGDAVYWIHLLVYVFMAGNYLNQHQVRNADKHYQLITAFKLFLIAWFPFLVLYISPYNHVLDPYSYYPICIPMTILIYWLGFHWFFHLSDYKSPVKSVELKIVGIDAKVEAAIQEGLFLDQELTVKSAAQKIGVPQRALSQFVNQHHHKSFNDFINSHRINE